MLNLASGTNLRIKASIAGDLRVSVSYVDLKLSDSQPFSAVDGKIIPPITTTAITEIVPSPIPQWVRNVKQVTVHNAGTVQNTVTIDQFDGVNTVPRNTTLPAGWRVEFDETGAWTVRDADNKEVSSAVVTGAFITSGDWNAATNTPTLVSGVGLKGTAYTVIAPGTTNLDGITQWNAKDIAYFDGVKYLKLAGSFSLNDIKIGLRNIANRCCHNEAQNTASVKWINSRSGHHNRSGQTLKKISVVISNYKAGELVTGGALTAFATIEYPSGTYTTLTFGGSEQVIIPDKGLVTSDEVVLSVPIPPDAVFWYRTHQSNPNGVMYNAFQSSVALGDGMYFSATSIARVTNAAINTSAGTANASCIRPAKILGYGTRPSLLFCGDSKTRGSGDSTNDNGGLSGYFERAYGHQYPFVNVAVGGEKLSDFISPANNVVRLQLAQHNDIVINGYVSNDIINGRTLSQIQADVATFSGLFPAMPVFNMTLTPRNTSTDSWATLANQTPLASESVRLAYNDWLRKGTYAPATGKGIAGIIDIAAILESATVPGAWIVNGSANYATNDGTHDSTAALTIVQNAYQMRPDRFLNFI